MSSKQSNNHTKNQITVSLNIGSPGIVMGNISKDPINLNQSNQENFEKDFSKNNELNSFHNALKKSRADIRSLVKKISRENKGSKAAKDVLESRLMALDDNFFITEITSSIIKKKVTAAKAIQQWFQEFQKKLKNTQPTMQEVEDIKLSLLENLSHKSKATDLTPSEIIFLRKLYPRQVAQLIRSGVRGVVVKETAENSHEMILCRALGLPSLYGKLIDEKIKEAEVNLYCIVDAIAGKLILNPPKKLRETYHTKINLLQKKKTIKTQLVSKKYKVFANLNDLSEIENLKKFPETGIGLYRSEFLFTEQNINEQKSYQKIFQEGNCLPPVIRLFDFSREKYFIPLKTTRKSAGPLGVRSIRALLKDKKILKNQINNILKASKKNNLVAKILIPMVTFAEEINEVRSMITESAKKIKSPKPMLGVMLETPASISLMPYIHQMVQFYSVGANDLLQYTLAIGRDETEIAQMASPLHPGFIDALKQIKRNARLLPISVCGEIAGDFSLLPILIALGYRQFSVSIRRIAQVHHYINTLEKSSCKELLQSIEKTPLIKKREAMLKNFISKNYPAKDYL